MANPLADYSDDDLVAAHSQHGADNQYISEMLRRLRGSLKDQHEATGRLTGRIETLNRLLLWFTIAIFVLTVGMTAVSIGVIRPIG